jgi:hypothetical protein
MITDLSATRRRAGLAGVVVATLCAALLPAAADARPLCPSGCKRVVVSGGEAQATTVAAHAGTLGADRLRRPGCPTGCKP